MTMFTRAGTRTVLAAALASLLAAPAFAQAAQAPDPTPPAQDQAQSPVPDTGIKKTTEASRTHHKTRHHHAHAAATPAPTTRG